MGKGSKAKVARQRATQKGPARAQEGAGKGAKAGAQNRKKVTQDFLFSGKAAKKARKEAGQRPRRPARTRPCRAVTWN